MKVGCRARAPSALAACIALLLCPPPVAAQPPPHATPESTPPPVTTVDLLAGGREGWQVPLAVRTRLEVADGVLTLPASGEWMLFPGRSGDLSLHLEFRFSSDEVYAGVLLHGVLPDPAGPVRRGYQVWVSDPEYPVGTTVSADGTTCRGTLATPAYRQAWRGHRAWQALDVRAEGERLDVSFNGTQVFSCTGGIGDPGAIGLRALNGTVTWRNLQLTYSTAPEPPAAAVQPPQLLPEDQSLAGDTLTPPVVLEQVLPDYTASAMERGIEGVVLVDCVIDEKGSVVFCMVATSLDPGLDEEAVNAAMKTRFSPALRKGVPTRCLARLKFMFLLRPKSL